MEKIIFQGAGKESVALKRCRCPDGHPGQPRSYSPWELPELSLCISVSEMKSGKPRHRGDPSQHSSAVRVTFWPKVNLQCPQGVASRDP